MPYYAVASGNVLECVEARSWQEAAANAFLAFLDRGDNVMYPDTVVRVSSLSGDKYVVAVQQVFHAAGLKRVEVVKQTMLCIYPV